MRRSVFFAVWLGLVLSLLKEAPAETPAETTVAPSSTPEENGTDIETNPDPLELTSSNDNRDEPTEDGPGNETDPDPPEMTTSKPTGSAAMSLFFPSPKDGPGNETDPDPPEMTTSKPTENGTENGTVTEPPEVTSSEPTEKSTVSRTAPAPTEMPPSVPPELVDFCRGDPCGRSSATCISLQSNYTCVCQYGFYYSNENCYKGKVYPATINVKAPYSDNLQNVNSTEYQYVFNSVSAFFKKAFENLHDYKETVIIKIQHLSESRNDAPLNVTVTNLFTWNSAENATTVSSAVQRAIEESPQSFVTSYNVAKHCDIYQCDPKTTVCEEEEFPECKCKPYLEKTKWDTRSCSACSKNCSAMKHRYCVQEEDGTTCRCMINFKEEAEECVACPVGFSGEDCTDYSELVLIIVGTVFGAIILSLVIAVSVISVRAKHKQNPEKRSLMKSGYSDMNTSHDKPSMFPRVQTTSGHANPGYQPNNPYEMRSTNRDHFPERDYDDLYEISREPRGFRTQSRY
ncbi:mucin-13 [Vidua chalybeata]|uniref:mucin-13 n=1 Tax=Vidua chalybeata TaxID=81927 RepID=UPI0023A7D821|nr:mucin-13 [Vidua chalybeata]